MNAKQTEISQKQMKELNVQAKIAEIKLDNFQVEKPVKSGQKYNFEHFQYEFNVNIEVQTTKQEIRVNLTVNIFPDLEKKNRIAQISSHGIFLVLNLKDILKDSDGKVPNVIFSNFIGVLISTTRGFLIDKSHKTLIDGAIIPIINPHTFFFGKK